MNDARYAELDSWIRSGRAAAARAELLNLARSKLSRASRVRVASLARRSNAPLLSLRILGPIVRPTGRLRGAATDEERLEYAAALVLIGVLPEAERLLESVDARACPMVDLHRAFAHIRRWDYGAARPWLEALVASPNMTEYQRLVGRINLAACLVAEDDFEGSSRILEALVEETCGPDTRLLHANALELSAQSAVFRENWPAARSALGRARSLLSEAGSMDHGFLEKWWAVLNVLESRGSPESLSGLSRVREGARSSGTWETVRDCDLFRSIATRDSALAAHVWFGSPHAAYRARMARRFSAPLELPERYEWRPSDAPGIGSSTGGAPSEGRLGERARVFDFGEAPRSIRDLLHTLASDFYSPFPLPVLFAALHPEEKFCLSTSPARIHQNIRRARDWLREHAPRLGIERPRAGIAYRIKGDSETRILKNRLEPALPVPDLARARSSFGDRWFGSRELQTRLRLPRRSAQRSLEAWALGGELERRGRSSASAYRFTRRKDSAS